MNNIAQQIEDIKQSIKNIEDNVIGVKELAKQVGSLPIYSIPDCGINSINEEGLYKSESGIIILVTSKEIEDTIEFTQYKFGDVIEKRVGNVPKNSNLTPKYPKEWVDIVEQEVKSVEKLLTDKIKNTEKDIENIEKAVQNLGIDINTKLSLLNNGITTLKTYTDNKIAYVKKTPNTTSIQSLTSINIYRNSYYRFKNSGSSISIYLYNKSDGYEDTTTDTFEFEFHVNSSYVKPTVYIYNISVKWANNTPPPYTPGKIYQINIQNGLGVWVEFNQ